jgi:hypothetical protein
MNRREIEAKLHQLHAQCLEDAISGRKTIAAQFDAEKKLNSSSFFQAVRDDLLDREKKCLQEMASFAVTALTPTNAASVIERGALRLHDDLRNILSSTLSGDCGSRPAFKIAAAEIQRTFRNRAKLNRVAIIHNVRYGPNQRTRGFWDRVRRNTTTLIAIAAMLVASAGLIAAILIYLTK